MRGRNFKMTRYGWFLSLNNQHEKSFVFLYIANLTIICLGM